MAARKTADSQLAKATVAMTNVFGVKPEGAIFNPNAPYGVRFNCQAGQLALSENDYLGREAEISIIRVVRFWGSLGKVQNTEWLQMFYIAAPDCDILPLDTVCVSYIKTRSLSGFNQEITGLLGKGINPAEGIFKVSFTPHSNDLGNYFSVRFDWRKRRGEGHPGDEIAQLHQIADFLATDPILLDSASTANMTCIEDLSAEEVRDLQRQSRKALPVQSKA